MGKILIFLMIAICSFANPKKISIIDRYVGQVTDVKVIAQDDQREFIFWVKAGTKEYNVRWNANLYIDTGDSLFEYFIDGQLAGIGTPQQKFFYSIMGQ